MQTITEKVQILKAIGNERRLPILQFLQKNKHATVGKIQAMLHMSLFATSQHLRILRSANLVTTTKRGRYVSYRLPLKQDEILKAVLRSL